MPQRVEPPVKFNKVFANPKSTSTVDEPRLGDNSGPRYGYEMRAQHSTYYYHAYVYTDL